MNKLYPLKFKPILKEKIWGGNKLKTLLNKKDAFAGCGESWEISAIQDSVSVVANGFLAGNNLEELIEIYFGDLVGDQVYAKFGIEFPILVKFIDTVDVLSVQVHPDNAYAKKNHKAFGKSEMWYVLQADENAEIINGFNQKLTHKAFEKKINDGTTDEVLNYDAVTEGDAIYIPAGRIHTIGKGILLAEIQQTSDITYRVHDWNRKDNDGNLRELHIQHALNVLDYNHYPNNKINYKIDSNKSTKILSSENFSTNIIAFDKVINRDYNLLDSFVIYMCTQGEFEIITDSGEKTKVEKGETVLLPASLKNISLSPIIHSKILEVYIEDLSAAN